MFAYFFLFELYTLKSVFNVPYDEFYIQEEKNTNSMFVNSVCLIIKKKCKRSCSFNRKRNSFAKKRVYLEVLNYM